MELRRVTGGFVDKWCKVANWAKKSLWTGRKLEMLPVSTNFRTVAILDRFDHNIAREIHRNGVCEDIRGLWDRCWGDADGGSGQLSLQHEVCSQETESGAESHQQCEGELVVFWFFVIRFLLNFFPQFQCIQFKTDVMPDLKRIEKFTGNLMNHITNWSTWFKSR